MSSRDDTVYVGHMLDTTRDAMRRVHGLSREQFDADDNLSLAVAHLVQTVGEAARRVSTAFQEQHPEIPWSKVIGMRHKVVHDYMSVDFDIVWDVVCLEFPTLAAQLERLVPPLEN
jgi:uncharacterized protein with HEPN domain